MMEVKCHMSLGQRLHKSRSKVMWVKVSLIKRHDIGRWAFKSSSFITSFTDVKNNEISFK